MRNTAGGVPVLVVPRTEGRSKILPPRSREPNGRLRRETVDEITALARENRRKAGVAEEHLSSPMAGSLLGRMRLCGEITARQFEAGSRWARIVVRHAQLLGIPSPHPRAIAWTDPAADVFGPRPDPDPATVRDVRAAYDDAFAALMDAPSGRTLLEALKTVVILDRGANVGDLRCALNILDALWLGRPAAIVGGTDVKRP